jgi:hypothetical protein
MTMKEWSMHTFPETARDQILVTLELTNQTLAAVEDELRHLERRATQLREFLRLGDAMLGEPCPETPAPPSTSIAVPAPDAPVRVDPWELVGGAQVPEPPTLPAWPLTKMTAAQKAKAVLDEVGYALDLQQMVEHLAERGVGNGTDDEKLREALRTALRNHPSMFRRVKRGVYALTAWGRSDAAS